ncbi:hypothetical protein AVEN_35004-1 [Araneus ventricosus]|uniref:Uncharacterized protein n=1 Tax=Araneus ventricosus TaxID=182803 RepID=A0A4Y2XC57_ARAVE|nr:hypothetical protein AVEN_35004-1 [Araneus ventricosus]
MLKISLSLVGGYLWRFTTSAEEYSNSADGYNTADEDGVNWFSQRTVERDEKHSALPTRTNRKRKNEELLDQRLSKGQLRSFSPNDAVYIKNHSAGPTWIPGTVIEKAGPLSYKNVTPDGRTVRCHIDQMRNRKTPLASPQFSPETQENSTIPVSSSAIPSSSNTPIQPSDPPAEIETSKKAPDESHLDEP